MTWIFHGTPELDAQSRYPSMIVVCVVFTSIMLVAVCTRFFLRRTHLGADDYVIAVTTIFSVAYSIQSIYQTRWGLGLPPPLRPKADVLTFTKLSYAGKPFYTFGISGFKLALCLSYLRLTQGAQKPVLRKVIVGVAVFSTVGHFVYMLVLLLFCRPLAKNFNPNIPGYCVPFGPFNYAMVAMTILCDVVIFLLPIPMFLPLKVDKKTKWGLCFLFACGLSTTVCSIVRATYLKDVVERNDNFMVVLVGVVEFNVGLTSCCLPFLRPLFKSGRRQYGYGDYYSNDAKRNYNLSNMGGSSKFRLGSRNSIMKSGENITIERTDSNENILDHESGRSRVDVPSEGIKKIVDFEVSRMHA